MWVKFLSRHSEVFKIYTKYLSCLVYNQVYNMFVCTLYPCLSSFPKKTEANYSEIPARSTCHESRGSAIMWVEIALHNMTHRDWPVTSGLFLSCEKNAISNLACCRYDIGMSWQSQIFILCSFYHRRLVIPERAKQYSLTLRKYTCSFLFVFVAHICPDF